MPTYMSIIEICSASSRVNGDSTKNVPIKEVPLSTKLWISRILSKIIHNYLSCCKCIFIFTFNSSFHLDKIVQCVKTPIQDIVALKKTKPIKYQPQLYRHIVVELKVAADFIWIQHLCTNTTAFYSPREVSHLLPVNPCAQMHIPLYALPLFWQMIVLQGLTFASITAKECVLFIKQLYLASPIH